MTEHEIAGPFKLGDQILSDIEVTGADLESAFMLLTNEAENR